MPKITEEYWQMIHEQYHPRIPCMNDLFRLAERDPTIRAFLQSWRTGNVTLEQTLIGLVYELAERNKRFEELASAAFQNAPSAPVIVKGR